MGTDVRTAKQISKVANSSYTIHVHVCVTVCVCVCDSVYVQAYVKLVNLSMPAIAFSSLSYTSSSFSVVRSDIIDKSEIKFCLRHNI